MNPFNFNVEIDKEHVRDNGEYDFGWIELKYLIFITGRLGHRNISRQSS